jgi:hypothetical protein
VDRMRDHLKSKDTSNPNIYKLFSIY